MPTALPPSQAARNLRSDGRLGLWALAAIGPVAVLWLAFAGALAARPAIVALFGLGLTTWWVINRLVLPRATEPSPRAPEQAVATRTPPFAVILENLPDPLMVVAAEEADDLTGRRFLFANAAARELFRIQSQGGLLVSAVRAPLVLEAVDESLFGGIERDVAFDTGGVQAREWTALVRPLGVDETGSHLALLVLRDETDARRSERTRADFLANASHELRTPLASLTGFIETLRGHAREDVGARDRFLGIMQAQAERMARLIDDLMSLSRIELNEHIAPLGQVDLAMAAIDVLDAVSPLARDKSVSFDPVLPPRGAAMVEGDRDQIVQVIQNLIDNALKYAPRDGTIRLEIFPGLSAEAAAAAADPAAPRMALLTPDHAAGERYAVLRVRDTGPGMARQTLPRLTERFYRVEGQKSGDRSGTGLGLAIVKHIMNRHRGGMTVESVEGAGAMFAIYLPMAKSGAA
jgi:two-component system phosphate regulon sensor histidine kinase PhoR